MRAQVYFNDVVPVVVAVLMSGCAENCPGIIDENVYVAVRSLNVADKRVKRLPIREIARVSRELTADLVDPAFDLDKGISKLETSRRNTYI